MKILGVHPTHTATAALLEDGKILSVISEERLNRIKEYWGLPVKAIDKILSLNSTSPQEIDLVAINGFTTPSAPSDFTRKTFNPYLSGFNAFKKIMPHALMKRNWWVKPAVNVSHTLRKKDEIYQYFERKGIGREKVIFVDHHTCHAYTSFLNPWGQTDDILLLTLDGAGDGYCGTISVVKKGKVVAIDKMNFYNSLGLLYSRLTQYLNMKPISHEYKVMGLAAYSKGKESEKVYRVLREKFMRIDPKNPLRMENLSGAVNWEYLDLFRTYFGTTRFDHLAGGAQKLVEELVHQWVLNCIKKTGIRNVFCTGGVFMNVKANMKLAYEKAIDRLFVFPSCGDESTAIGACYYGYKLLSQKRNTPFKPAKLSHIYFGNETSEEETQAALARYKDKVIARKIKNPNAFVASLLAKGEIVARCSGPMEFGARALGNRSILAHPNKNGVVREINEAIKQRDFWMPFACSMLKERAKDYLVNPHNVDSPFMILSFETTPLAQRELINGMHAYDLTCRPQVVSQEANPDYHAILKTFEKQTGIGGILNTSLNIHGEPVVCTAEDALSTLVRSGLNHLIIDNYYIQKKSA